MHRTLEQKFTHITQLAELLRQGLLNRIEKVFDNSPPNCHERIPGIVSLVFTDVSAENLILGLDMKGFVFQADLLVRRDRWNLRM